MQYAAAVVAMDQYGSGIFPSRNWRAADLVNAAYGLTAEEVALLWRTAPPRMPGEGPGG